MSQINGDKSRFQINRKRKLKQLVDEKHVSGWDDPRMPTLSGLRRRGYTPASIRNFCDLVGVTRSEGVVDVGLLEFAIRDDLDKRGDKFEEFRLQLSNARRRRKS